jgi:hypothetical protein
MNSRQQNQKYHDPPEPEPDHRSDPIDQRRVFFGDSDGHLNEVWYSVVAGTKTSGQEDQQEPESPWPERDLYDADLDGIKSSFKSSVGTSPDTITSLIISVIFLTTILVVATQTLYCCFRWIP